MVTWANVAGRVGSIQRRSLGLHSMQASPADDEDHLSEKELSRPVA